MTRNLSSLLSSPPADDYYNHNLNTNMTVSFETTMPSTNTVMDFQRLKNKIDRMAVALEKLVLVEDRQSNQAISITELKAQVEANKIAIQTTIEFSRNSIDRVEKKVDQWINRGIGVWALAGIVFVVVQTLLKMSGKGG